jgi:hypothetical protein
MPTTYLEILPEDILRAIYAYLYSSILRDMNNNDNYKNTKHFHKLLRITEDPLIDNLDYLGCSECINYSLYYHCKYDIFKYKKNKKEYEELYNDDDVIYKKTYYTKQFDIVLDNIVISNGALYALYCSNKRYYRAFVSEYMQFDSDRDTNANNTTFTIKIKKGNFILTANKSFNCLADLLYSIINFYDIIKNEIYKNIEALELQGILEMNGQILTARLRKDKYILEDMRNQHINNRFLERLNYDIHTRTAIPQLGFL